MIVIGSAPRAVLAKIEQRGLTPKQAVDALLVEAERRFPTATVVIVKADHHDGIDLVAV